MRKTWTPSIVPSSTDQDIYLVLDDLGRLGRVWREADVERTGCGECSTVCRRI